MRRFGEADRELEEKIRKIAERQNAPREVTPTVFKAREDKEKMADDEKIADANLTPEEAFCFHKQLAEAGDAQAQYLLAEDYWNGTGCEEDLSAAEKWYRAAANQGHPQAAFKYASGCMVDQNYAEALKYFEPLIKADMTQFKPEFLMEIARLYLGGAEGVPKNFDKALPIYKYVADTTHDADAQTMVAVMLTSDLDMSSGFNEIKRRFEEAERYLVMAANVGNEDAKKLLVSTRDLLAKAKAYESAHAPSSSGTSSSSGGCYVATAVYGSYDCPQVWTLRRFRDRTLAGTWYGRLFIRIYYAVSPVLVRWFGDCGWFRSLWRGPLDRLVRHLQSQGIPSTPYRDAPGR